MSSPKPVNSATAAPTAAAPAANRLTFAAALRRTGARFYVCLAVLLVAAGGMQTLATLLGRNFIKRAVALRQPLALFDKQRLAPDFEPHPQQPPPMSEEAIGSLGTNEYLSLRIVDLTRERQDPTSVAHLFVTYYTGQPDMVPHTPDQCYAAGGYDLNGRPREITLTIPGSGAPQDAVPVRVLNFKPPQKGLRPAALAGVPDNPTAVMYTFHSNGRYAGNAWAVRLLQSNTHDQYAYYAKIEFNFTNYGLTQRATTEQSLEALPRALRKILPILLEDHLPDWSVYGGAGPAAAAAGTQRE